MKLKHIILSAVLALVGIPAFSQVVIPDDLKLTKADIDTTSYFLGLNFGSFIKGNEFKGLDLNILDKGLADFMTITESSTYEEFISKLKYDPDSMNDVFVRYLDTETPSASQVDSASYLMGVNFGTFVFGNEFPMPDFTPFNEGINDFMKAKIAPGEEGFSEQFRMDPYYMDEFFSFILMKQQIFTVQINLLESEAFIEDMKKQPGMMTTESGLVYKILEPGDQSKKPRPQDDVTVNYRGTRMDGSVFDQHMGADDTMTFRLENVIDGWTEGLQLIGEGGKMMLYLHPDLAYGGRGAGDDIAPNSALVFEISLVGVKRTE